jgi:hypothetical protein
MATWNRPLPDNSLLTHGCCGVDARLHDKYVRRPESQNSPFPDNVSVSGPVTMDTQIATDETFKRVL